MQRGILWIFDKHRGMFGNYFLYSICFQKPLGANQNTEKKKKKNRDRGREKKEEEEEER